MIVFEPIGVIHTPYTSLAEMPIQPGGDPHSAGTLVLLPEYEAGLQDLEGFSHIYLLYHFHQAGPAQMKVTPFLDDQSHGLFATRAPRRPNPIGLSVVRLENVEGCTLHIRGLDVLDGTPLLDIKPYLAAFDHPEESTSGWMQATRSEVGKKRSDKRFV